MTAHAPPAPAIRPRPRRMSGANLAVALIALGAALVLTLAAIRSPRRTLVAAALAMSALACLAQTYAFLGYTTPG